MSEDVWSHTGYSYVTGKPTFKWIPKETTMSDELKVIAELEDFMRVTEGGRLQEWNDPGGRPGMWVSKDGDDYIPGSVLAELLADAVRRANHRLDGMDLSLNELTERIEALEKDPFVEHGKRQALEDRLEAVEKALGGTQKVGERALITETRDALESRQEGDWKWRANQSQQAADRLMESRQQDEAGEGTGPVGGMALTDDERNDLSHRRHIRSELAREIAKEMRRTAGTERAPGINGIAWADWIEREFGGE